MCLSGLRLWHDKGSMLAALTVASLNNSYS